MFIQLLRTQKIFGDTPFFYLLVTLLMRIYFVIYEESCGGQNYKLIIFANATIIRTLKYFNVKIIKS
ncbi:MAG: hypothetical protein AMDU5_GPLC00004G0209 [Thermoplasmatales archaeon Gpl]|nr:MAG: hypothetical protein AMDU5_GPLC00004G0209 [Thermoplasmatales archaeon Gpl]